MHTPNPTALGCAVISGCLFIFWTTVIAATIILF